MEGELESIVMSTSDPKSIEQNEKKQDITKNIQSSTSSPTKQEEADDSAGGRQAQAAQPSLWKKCKKLIMRSRGQKTEGKPDGSPPAATQKLIASINSDISFISEVKEELEDYYSNSITKKLDILKDVYEEIKKKKNLEGDEKVANLLSELSEDLMRLKLAVPQKYKGGAEKKDPKNLKFSSEEILGGWGASEMMPQLHMSEVLGASMELEEFVGRYNKLEHPLKLCLLCFSIFQKDAIIKKRLMVQWWVVEGYAPTEGVAAGYFEELIEKGFLEAVNDNRSPTVGSCRIHPFNRSALVALAERAKLFNFGGGGEPTQNFSGCFQACLMGAGLISYDDFTERYKSSGKGDNNNNNQKKVIQGLINELEKLHLLINVDEHILEFVDEWFSKMKNLNILYLGRWKASAAHHIEVEDAKFLKKLENMKYVKLISFQGVSNIIVLPDSILEMRKLEVLDLRACYNLETIPERIGWALKMLTHLDMSECYLLSHMPKTLAQLTHLKVLKGFFVGKNYAGGCTLDDLKNLKLLEKLCIYTKWKEFLVEGNVPDLEGLASLTKLTITWGVSHIDDDQEQKPSDAPKKNGKVAKLPSNAPKKNGKVAKLPSKLTKLDLKCFPMPETPEWLKLKNLGHTQLTKLYIRGGEFSDLGQYQGIDEDHERSTWKVEVLRLKYLGKIEMEWRRLHDLFPNLKYLEKVSCPKLTLFPCDANGVWIKPAP